MSQRLLPATKLNLAARKTLRDVFDAKKPELEKELSELLGVPWTFKADPLALAPYAELLGDSTGLGRTIFGYFSSAIGCLKYYKEEYGEDGVNELNELAPAHTITIDLNEDIPDSKAFAYTGCDIKDGVVRLLFAKTAFGSNLHESITADKLLKVLAEAPPPSGAPKAMSFAARTSIAQGWDAKFEAVQSRLRAMVGNPKIKFVPNFDDAYEKLSAESARPGTKLAKDWEERLGQFTYSYFDTVVNCMPGGTEDFENDEMLKEGFNDAVEGEIAFRIVDKLLKPNNWCESQIEGGTLYFQTTAEKWGSNPSECYSTLVEAL